MSELPDHLGGHLDKVHVDVGLLDFLKKRLDIKTMMDIGCGPGWQISLALARGIDAFGIDGDFTIDFSSDVQDRITLYDFAQGSPDLSDEQFDLAWSVEFLEHVEEEYMANYMSVFQRCKYVVCTHATPDMPGHHHVNLQKADYWIDRFEEYGFEYDYDRTVEIRAQSTMTKKFMQTSGLFFVRED